MCWQAGPTNHDDANVCLSSTWWNFLRSLIICRSHRLFWNVWIYDLILLVLFRGMIHQSGWWWLHPFIRKIVSCTVVLMWTMCCQKRRESVGELRQIEAKAVLDAVVLFSSCLYTDKSWHVLVKLLSAGSCYPSEILSTCESSISNSIRYFIIKMNQKLQTCLIWIPAASLVFRLLTKDQSSTVFFQSWALCNVEE